MKQKIKEENFKHLALEVTEELWIMRCSTDAWDFRAGEGSEGNEKHSFIHSFNMHLLVTSGSPNSV